MSCMSLLVGHAQGAPIGPSRVQSRRVHRVLTQYQAYDVRSGLTIQSDPSGNPRPTPFITRDMADIRDKPGVEERFPRLPPRHAPRDARRRPTALTLAKR